MARDPADRFWEKVATPNDRGCREWQGSVDDLGYGLFFLEGRTRRTHRISYVWAKGAIPTGMIVCHACDNPRCVNPDHLWLGTHKENAHDRDRKGRQVAPTGDQSSRRLHPESYTHLTGANHPVNLRPELIKRGERHNMARLTWEIVCSIRARYAAGGVSYQQIATIYGISKTNAGDIIRGVIWKTKE